MRFERKSGLLLHPTSLPSTYGIGDLGPEAYEFVDFLKDSGQSLWQILPLNPVGYGNSPYQCFSAFAGNPLLISIDRLLEEGFLRKEDIGNIPAFPDDTVNFSIVNRFKERLFLKAFQRYTSDGLKGQSINAEGYNSFYYANNSWLDDYCLFMALREHFEGWSWNLWEKDIALRKSDAVKKYSELLSEKIKYHKFLQFLFFNQWQQLKEYANAQGIKIIGDIPIFVSYDSSDAWVNPELFELDSAGNPTVVAGVPPDYFSETGQRWGNPLYSWGEMEKDDYQWWRERFEILFRQTDIVRVDHFMGFEAYWEVPAEEETALNGRWVKGPGKKFFKTVEKHLGEMPIIAEDLGLITPEVDKLREDVDYPGMKIFQFMLQTGAEETLSALYDPDRVMYTGTHDNETLWGWYLEALRDHEEVITRLEKYFQIRSCMKKEEICWRLIQIVMESKAIMAILPVQDILNLDSTARMNTPGTTLDNWQWRFKKESLTEELAAKLSKSTMESGRG